MGETVSSHSLNVVVNNYVFRSCSDGSSPTIYNTAAPLGNGSDPENYRFSHTWVRVFLIEKELYH